MTHPDLPEHVKRNRDLWDRWAKDYAEVGARAWAGAEPSWGIWSVPERLAYVGSDGFPRAIRLVSTGTVFSLFFVRFRTRPKCRH